MPSNSSNTAILSKLVKRLKAGDSDPLRPLVDEYLLKRDASPRRYRVHPVPVTSMGNVPGSRPAGRISPSGLVGCERQAVFKFIGVKGRRRIDPDQELVWDAGTWIGHKWQAVFLDMQAVLGKKRFKVVSFEEPVQYDELYIAGTLDVLVRIEGVLWIIEIKSINDQGYHYILRTGQPILSHVYQLITYERSRRVHRGVIWYENKNKQETQAFVVDYRDSAWLEVRRWSRSVISYMKRQQLPPMHPDCKRGNIYFERCSYAGLCYGTRTPEKLTAYAYRGFTSLGELWEAGHDELVG